MTTTRLPQEVKTFVRRGSRMTTSQRHWLDRHGPAYLVDVRREARVTSIPPQPPLDLAAVFGRGTAPLVVEIGSGHGETLAFAAERHPDWDFLGFEVFDAALASTLGKLAAADLKNVRLVAGDGLEGLEHLLPPAAIMELWLFFPDPWHKSRHHKRRLVSQSFADLAASRLRPGGVLRLATDWDDYAAWTRAVLDPHPAFERLDAGRCPDRPETKFEARGRAAGRTIHDLAYV
ncbi:MAG: tRNA (guanosine(46)-N7)-methyltransferase TrmB, partial [Propionibacteriaceae bacterium]|nr:tRNA (guanosine(46)-N7)-methyltransferase TrmB [Propionibacteriaceae bacterium]